MEILCDVKMSAPLFHPRTYAYGTCVPRHNEQQLKVIAQKKNEASKAKEKKTQETERLS